MPKHYFEAVRDRAKAEKLTQVSDRHNVTREEIMTGLQLGKSVDDSQIRFFSQKQAMRQVRKLEPRRQRRKELSKQRNEEKRIRLAQIRKLVKASA